MDIDVMKLFKDDRALARAMEDPSLYRQSSTNKVYYDFSDILSEMNEARTKGKDAASTTLLLEDENIPTYKAFGFLLDGDRADIIHISEKDSGSHGEVNNGDFYAYGENIESLDKLATNIRAEQGRHSMNEVNICARDDAYVGIFASTDKRSQVFGIILQKLNEMHMKKKLPIYVYEREKGILEKVELDIDKKIDMIKECMESKKISVSDIYYSIDGEEYYMDILDELEKEKQQGYSYVESDIDYQEEWNQNLKDYSGKVIGSRRITDSFEKNTGRRVVETRGSIENEDGKYEITEISVGVSEQISSQKHMDKHNKITGEKEELDYKKDEQGESYIRKVNGQLRFKIVKTERGVSIDEYRNGQPYSTYEYDESGKAIIGIEGIDQIDDDFISKYFDTQVPYFEAETLERPEQKKTVEEDKGKTFSFGEELRSMVNSEKEIIDKDLENGDVFKEEKQYDEKVEKGDDDYIM